MKRPVWLQRAWDRAPLPPLDVTAWTMMSLGAAGLATAAIMGGNWQAVADGDGIGRDRSSYIAGLDPKRRFQHDYNGFDDSGDDCLHETGYDLWDPGHNQLITVGTLTVKDGVYVIEPGGSDEGKPALHLKADQGSIQNGHLPLQPADEQAVKILNQYDCALSYAA